MKLLLAVKSAHCPWTQILGENRLDKVVTQRETLRGCILWHTTRPVRTTSSLFVLVRLGTKLLTGGHAQSVPREAQPAPC